MQVQLSVEVYTKKSKKETKQTLAFTYLFPCTGTMLNVYKAFHLFAGMIWRNPKLLMTAIRKLNAK